MAETDKLYELGWELGLSGPVFNEVYTLLVLIYYI